MNKRIEWVDTLKAIGIFFVFYGHYIEVVSDSYGEGSSAYKQFEFIYSFHMPLFFMISGFFSRNHKDKIQQLKKLFLSRIIPVVSFALFLLPMWFLRNIIRGDVFYNQVISRSFNYIKGHPSLDWMTWFLVCLFTAEVLCLFLGLIQKNKITNLILGLFLVVMGYFFVESVNGLSKNYKTLLNFCFFSESIIALGFYLIGNAVFPLLSKLQTERKTSLFIVSAIVSFITMLFVKNDEVVIMAIHQHGLFLPFILNAILGSIFLVSLCMLIPVSRLMNFIGSNTIILLGLNGVFFHFLNEPIFNLNFIDDSWWNTTLNSVIVSVLSILVCVPFILFINKYVPQLFGKPFENGPILKPINEYLSFE